MHLFAGAQYGIYRASLNAQGAADAKVFDDYGDFAWFFYASFRIERHHISVEQIRQCLDAGFTARRAPIDFRFSAGDGFRVWPATGEVTLTALCFWQQCLDLIDDRIIIRTVTDSGETQHEAKNTGKTCDGDDGRKHDQPFTRPANPMKANAISPAVISAMAEPLKGVGTSAAATRSRIPENRIITSENPTAAPNP